MLFSVVQTHCEGVRLTRDEIKAATPIVGRLEISDWAQNYSGRSLKVAKLRNPNSTLLTELLLPIFEPIIVKMTDKGFLISGYQLKCLDTGKMAEYVQGWWVRHADHP